MTYLVAPQNIFSHIVTTDGNIEWDSTHFCPASKLTAQEATQFSVFPLILTPPPTFDPMTQNLNAADPVLVNGVWTQQWSVTSASAQEISDRQAAATATTNGASLDTAIANDAIIANLKTLNNTDFHTWFVNNVTNLSQAQAALERLTRIIVRRVL